MKTLIALIALTLSLTGANFTDAVSGSSGMGIPSELTLTGANFTDAVSGSSGMGIPSELTLELPYAGSYASSGVTSGGSGMGNFPG